MTQWEMIAYKIACKESRKQKREPKQEKYDGSLSPEG